MINFGVMQGRLTKKEKLQEFPYQNWQKEFNLLSTFGFNCIEWLIDKRDDDKNIFFDKNFTYFKNEQEGKMVNAV